MLWIGHVGGLVRCRLLGVVVVFGLFVDFSGKGTGRGRRCD